MCIYALISVHTCVLVHISARHKRCGCVSMLWLTTLWAAPVAKHKVFCQLRGDRRSTGNQAWRLL